MGLPKTTTRLPVLCLLLVLAVACIPSVRGDKIDPEIFDFLKEKAPASYKLFRQMAREGDEGLEEARERGRELREIYLEAKEELGEAWAELVLALEDNEAEIELLAWRFEEGEIDEDDGEAALRKLVKEQLDLLDRFDKHEIKQLEEEAAELRDAIKKRAEDREEAVDQRMQEILEDLGFGGEDQPGDEFEEEDEEEEDDDDPIYVPGPKVAAKEREALASVTFDFGKDIEPVLEQFCFDCHDSESAKGDIDLMAGLAQTPLVRNRSLWVNVAERIKLGDMPPDKKPQPSEIQRLKLRAWLAQEVEEFDYASVRNPGHVPARRLTRKEYNRTIRDLVGLDLRPADEFPIDFTGTSGFSNSANTLFLQTAHLDRYFTAADGIIEAVRSDKSAAWKALAGSASEAPGAKLEQFLGRAYRRPATQEELSAVISQYESAIDAGKSRDDSIAAALKFVLISPKFLLRVENVAHGSGDQAVDGYDLASRLSYFIWASTPDDELLAAATAGKLTDPSQRRAQVVRMLEDKRSQSLGEIFAAEWLSTDDVGPRIRKDPIDNPWFTESLMAAMRNETARFFHSLVSDNAPAARLIDADYTFLNDELAKFYRVRGVEGKQMRKVRLNTKQRGGLLGHASVLATTSFPDRTSPVVRGAWILDTLLGTPPPPPPPNVPEIDVEGGGARAAKSLRKKLEIHRDSKRCSGCHSQIDPLGFALESFAEFGQWRNGVDNRGTLPGGATFRGPAGLKLALIDTRGDDLGTQVIRKMLAYALGRQLEYYDEAIVQEIAAKLKPGGYRLRDLVIEITDCYPFTTRRVPPRSDD